MQKIIVCIKDFSFSLLTVFNNHVLCILCKEPCTLLLTHSQPYTVAVPPDFFFLTNKSLHNTRRSLHWKKEKIHYI